MKPDFGKISVFYSDLEAFQSGDSYKLFLFLRENRTLMTILCGNYRELNKILDYHNSEQIREKMWDFDPNFRFRLQKRIILHLSNYLSSIFAVADYSRKTIRKYLEENEEILVGFDRSKDSFISADNHHKFIQDLRNYTSHNTFIKIGSEFSYNIEWTEPRKSIYVQKEEMLQWDGWSQDSKAFLISQGDKIRLNEILKTHFIQFSNFQHWVYMQILLVHKDMTETFIADIGDIYERAVAARMSHQLIFNKAYVRYIKCVYRKALHTTMHINQAGGV